MMDVHGAEDLLVCRLTEGVVVWKRQAGSRIEG